VARLLLAAGADVRSGGRRRLAPLDWAVRYRDLRRHDREKLTDLARAVAKREGLGKAHLRDMEQVHRDWGHLADLIVKHAESNGLLPVRTQRWRRREDRGARNTRAARSRTR